MTIVAWPTAPQDPSRELISVGRLLIDTRVQRATNKARVNQMARDFQPEALGVITVSRRDDGTVWVIDGGHRVKTAAKVKGPDWLMDCKVHHELTLAQEARLFRLLNDNRQVLPLDKFKARLEEGEKGALAIAERCQRHGVLIGSHLKAISAVEQVYLGIGVPRLAPGERCPDAVDAMLEIVIGAWGRPSGYSLVFNGHILRGIGSVFAYHPQADRDKLARRLAQQGDAATFYGAMKALQQGTHNGLWRQSALLTINHLNHRLQRDRLQNPWLGDI